MYGRRMKYVVALVVLAVVGCSNSDPDDSDLNGDTDQTDNGPPTDVDPVVTDDDPPPTPVCTFGQESCCLDYVIDGELRTECSRHVFHCIGGPGCPEGEGSVVYLRTCTAEGNQYQRTDCVTKSWVGNPGTSAETIYNLCTSCAAQNDRLGCFSDGNDGDIGQCQP